MLPPAQEGAPLYVPPAIHLLLWPALILWATTLIDRRGRWPRLRSPAVWLPLVLATFAADGLTVAASLVWPTSASNSFIFALLWLAILLSVTTFLVLRVPDQGEGGGWGRGEGDPEPPWWPDFERQLRDYTRERSRGPSSRPPRTPTPVAAGDGESTRSDVGAGRPLIASGPPLGRSRSLRRGNISL